MPILNERERQTYYGALDIVSHQVWPQAQDKGNTACTIAFLKHLQEQMPGQRLLMLWDGASYPRSDDLKAYLAQVNDGLAEDEWRIHCVRFAPNDPTQNPIEDVWLQAKTWLRRQAGWQPSFSALKALFDLFFTLEIFDFPKIHMYGCFSAIKWDCYNQAIPAQKSEMLSQNLRFSALILAPGSISPAIGTLYSQG